MKNIKIEANTNFHTATDTSVFDLKFQDERFKEYRQRWYEYPSNFIVGVFPIHLDIESTSLCNLRCPFCATTFDEWGPSKKGFMEFDMFTRIVDEGINNNLFSIKLSLRGEPLLHKQLADMIKYAKKSAIIDVYFNTNAVLLDEDKTKRLIDARLDRISISFEGTTKDVYEQYRIGACYEEVVENVRRLRKIRDSLKSNIPQIRVQAVLLPELRDSFGNYVKFWEAIADEVAYLDHRNERRKDTLHEQKECQSEVEDINNWACPFLWQRMTILWDGTVLPCLMHGLKDFTQMVLGNVNESCLYEMWHSSKFRYYRDIHMAGQAHKIETCRKCSYRRMELKKLLRTKI